MLLGVGETRTGNSTIRLADERVLTCVGELLTRWRRRYIKQRCTGCKLGSVCRF